MACDQQWRENAKQALARVSKGQIRHYSTYDFGRERNNQCLSIILSKAEARSLRSSTAPEVSVRLSYRDVMPQSCRWWIRLGKGEGFRQAQ